MNYPCQHCQGKARWFENGPCHTDYLVYCQYCNGNGTRKYKVLYCDPPWKFKDKLPGKKRGAIKHYKCLTIDELKSFPIPETENDAYLFMWRVASMQQEALDLVKAWGFEVKSEIVWDKITKKGKPHFGMGRHVRASHEVCLVCVKGKIKPKSKSVRSRFEAVVRKHSQKPDEMYDIIEQLSDGPYVELFARQRWQGWDSYGNEL